MRLGGQPRARPIREELRTIATNAGPVGVLVVKPVGFHTAGAERSRSHGAANDVSPMDAAICSAVRSHASEARALLFQACHDDGSWGFSSELDGEELDQAAYAVIRGMLGVYREVVRAGWVTVFSSDFDPVTQMALRRGTEMRLEELDSVIHPEEIWVYRHLAFFTTLGLERVLSSVLPGKMRMLMARNERRRRAG